jgi:small subunit ribosomal protein S6
MAENALMRYEVLFVAVPGITSDEAATIETQFKELIASIKGSVLSFEKWGKYHLAYEVEKNDYGVYFLARFELPAQDLGISLEKLRQFFAVKYSETIMRHMVARLALDASLEYKRPESMEDMPRREEIAGKRDRGYEPRSAKTSSHDGDDLDIDGLEQEA